MTQESFRPDALSEEYLYPLLGTEYEPEDYIALDLSRQSPLLQGWPQGDQDDLERRIRDAVEEQGGLIAWGGYLEDRALYLGSAHFGEARSLHLGVDLWTEVGHGVYAPLDGRVHSFAYNGAALDYGGTINLEHSVPGGKLYTLYGHLAKDDLELLERGMIVDQGTCFAHVGAIHENGGWSPHLHFQLILDVGGWKGDFPGVALPAERAQWAARCPDPAILLDFCR